ncbi:hypothetical protein AMECASPLE_015889 [Ameca splendens]|uniref:Uncharacterized protein n=1 Tax=Ameca splendens TaxID=208324 RepID=A0ABV0ZXT9_9TELE
MTSRVHRSPVRSIFRDDKGQFLSLSLSLQPVMLRDPRLGVDPDDGENQRRIGRSLSGTVMTSRRSRLTATRSFELSGSAGSFWLCLTGVKLSSDQSPALLH